MMKKAAVLSAVSLCVFLSDAPAGRAGAREAASTWKAVGPQGGSIKAMAFSEQDKNEIFAAVGAAVYQTKNGGSTWKRIIVADDTLIDVVPDAASSTYLSLLSDEYIFRYRNTTTKWLKKDFGNSTYAGDGPLVVDPKIDEVFHVAGRTYEGGASKMAYLKTLDGGYTWKARVVASFPRYGVLNEIAVCPLNPAAILVGGWGQDAAYRSSYKIYRSVNGGATWADKSGPIKDEARDIVYHPTNKNKAYVATTSNIWRSADGGATWKANNGEAAGYCLAIDPASPNTVYAGHFKKLYRSADGGVNWKATPEGFTGTCHALLVSSRTVYAGTLTGLFWSRNGGTTWAPRQKGINAGQAWAMAVAPSSPDIVYAALRYDGLYRSQDSGQTWTRLPSFTNWEYISQIQVSPSDPAKVLLLVGNLGAVPDTLYRSADGGLTWTSLFAGNMERIAARGNDFERLVGAGQVQDGPSFYLGTHVSSDGGATWASRKISTEPGTVGTAVAVAPSDDRVLFVGGGLGYSPRLFKSSDGGTTWQDLSRRVASDMGISALAVDPLTPNIVYLGAWGLFRSEDGGLTWVKKVKNNPAYTILVHPTVPGAVYAGFFDGCYRSLDGGLVWQSFKEALGCTYVRWLDLNLTNNILYAATAGGSVYKRQL